MRTHVVHIERTVNYNFKLIDDNVDSSLDISQLLNNRIGSVQNKVNKSLHGLADYFDRSRYKTDSLFGLAWTNRAAILSQWFSTYISTIVTTYTLRYEAFMSEINQIYALAQLPMGRAPPLISTDISRMICDIYAEHRKYSPACETGSVLNDVFLTGSSLNQTHLTITTSIPWGEGSQDSAATIFSLLQTPKPTKQGQLEIYSLSKKASAIIYERDTISVIQNSRSCSKFNDSVFCKELPRMLLGSDRDCASALLLAPKMADKFCEKTYIPMDCNLSPIFHLSSSLFYFTGGCKNILNIFQGSNRTNSTTKSTLFELQQNMMIAVNATTMLKAQKVFRYETEIINNDTLMIAPDPSYWQFNHTALHIQKFNHSLVWDESDIDLGPKIQSKLKPS